MGHESGTRWTRRMLSWRQPETPKQASRRGSGEVAKSSGTYPRSGLSDGFSPNDPRLAKQRVAGSSPGVGTAPPAAGGTAKEQSKRHLGPRALTDTALDSPPTRGVAWESHSQTNPDLERDTGRPWPRPAMRGRIVVTCDIVAVAVNRPARRIQERRTRSLGMRHHGPEDTRPGRLGLFAGCSRPALGRRSHLDRSYPSRCAGRPPGSRFRSRSDFR